MIININTLIITFSNSSPFSESMTPDDRYYLQRTFFYDEEKKRVKREGLGVVERVFGLGGDGVEGWWKASKEVGGLLTSGLSVVEGVLEWVVERKVEKVKGGWGGAGRKGGKKGRGEVLHEWDFGVMLFQRFVQRGDRVKKNNPIFYYY